MNFNLIEGLNNFDQQWQNLSELINKNIGQHNFKCLIFSSSADESIFQYTSNDSNDYSALREYIEEFGSTKNASTTGKAHIIQGKEKNIMIAIVASVFTHSQHVEGAFYFEFENKNKDYIQLFNDSLIPLNLYSLTYWIQREIEVYENLFYTIDLFTELIAKRDRFMPYHMSNVANRSMLLANRLNLSRRDRFLLYIAALLHDIGKIDIDERIINKPGRLTEEEYETMKDHPRKGYDITWAELHGIKYLEEVPEIILHHHERYDGKGYPDQLSANDIPYLSRVLSIADTVDAMISVRSYKNQFTKQEIINELDKFSGSQFDPEIAKVMIDVLSETNEKSVNNQLKVANFIPKASIVLEKENGETSHFMGNIVINENIGKFIIHQKEGKSLEKTYHNFAYIGYFMYGEFVQYRAKVQYTLKNQIILSSFIYQPLDRLAFTAYYSNAYVSTSDSYEEVQIIKLGARNLIIEIDITSSLYIKEHQKLNLYFSTHKDFFMSDYNVIYEVVRKYIFDNRIIIHLESKDIAPRIRDEIMRTIFDKQLNDANIQPNVAIGQKN